MAKHPWAATVLTLMPDAFPGALGVSVIERARKDGIWALETVDIRAFASDKHRSVDGPPSGGGPGMVLRADILAAAFDAVQSKDTLGRPGLVMSPRGRPLDQKRVRELSEGPGLIAICGRFEGIDQRFLEARNVEEVALGDFVLAGGEVAAQAMIEAAVRLLPGVTGAKASIEDESFETGLLEYPQYTKPQVWEGREIPEILVSGHHGRVAEWRRAQAEELTARVRPDLWRKIRRN